MYEIFEKFADSVIEIAFGEKLDKLRNSIMKGIIIGTLVYFGGHVLIGVLT